MGSETYHEPLESLSQHTKDMHRGIVSLIEELEAIDWYQQRAEAATDDELRAVLLHNKVEEVEHAMMNLEWLRRNSPDFDEKIRTYLLKDAPITDIEALEARGEAAAVEGEGAAPKPARALASGSLGIGSLKGGL